MHQGSARLSVSTTFRDETRRESRLSLVSGISRVSVSVSSLENLHIPGSRPGLGLVFSLHTGCCSNLVPLYMEKCLSQSLFGKKMVPCSGFFCIFTQVWKSQYQSQSRPSSLSLDLGLELLTFLGLDLSLESRPDMGKVSISVSVSKMLVSTAAGMKVTQEGSH